MSSDGDSFSPRIQSVFYAVFDVRQGPKIVYQVPEGLIATNSAGPYTTTPQTVPSTPFETEPPANQELSSSVISPISRRSSSRVQLYPLRHSSSSTRVLFHFDEISKYVIPPSPLCGRLVICATKKHRIIGFPMMLRGRYERIYFRYNLCFVFDRAADLSCYEPVVRKVSRVLTACEEESAFLSSPDTSPTLHPILEQLYEDLNSYAETSISIDKFNSIELKILPFYPNPPQVKDWMVPVALINLANRIEPNGDLTVVKICPHIDGINHVSRIAHLADCDLELTRQAVSHLLYYQVVMTIDIFQYSNMYTLRKSIQWLANEDHVQNECGPYVTKPGSPIADWPKLLHLYSRLRPGRTVWQWMELFDTDELGIDVRRFTSFGVIKGFLRRVHRWPILVKGNDSPESPNAPMMYSRKRQQSYQSALAPIAASDRPPWPVVPETGRWLRGSLPDTVPTVAPVNAELSINMAIEKNDLLATSARHSSAAEKVLERLRTRSLTKPVPLAPRSAALSEEGYEGRRVVGQAESRRHSLMSTYNAGGQSQGLTGLNALKSPRPLAPPSSPVLSRPRLSRSPSTPHMAAVSQSSAVQPPVAAPSPPYPLELSALLNGDHHTDELCTKFKIGWPVLERWLIAIGRGKGDGDLGDVEIILR